FACDEADFLEFIGCKMQKFFVLHAPQIVTLVAEVLQTEPDTCGVGNQCGAPVIENLQSPDAHVGLLNVDPIVGRSRTAPHALQKQAGGHKASIWESGADSGDMLV